MHTTNLNKIKLSFLAIVVGLIIMLTGGIYLLKGNYYLSKNYILMEFETWKLGQEFQNDLSLGFFPSLSFFGQKDDMEQIRSGNAQSVPVLLYHGVIDDPNWQPDGVNVSIDDFKKQMFALKQAGFKTISLSDFQAFINGQKKLPEKSVLITFNDGRSDSYYNGDPVLNALGMRAVMFVITGRSMEKNNNTSKFHLNQVELQKMIESGRWELGSHTQNGHDWEKIDSTGNKGHFLTDKLWLENLGRQETNEEFTKRITTDLVGSKEDLENKLGVNVIGFAYPFGDWGNSSANFPASKDILAQIVNNLFPLTFRQVAESEYPGNYPGSSFRMIKRIGISSEISSSRLISLLAGAEEKSLLYEDTFFKDNGWLDGWGKSKLEHGLLLTEATADENSSLTFLDGTALWKDYRSQADVELVTGNSFSVVARYNNGNNYASCDFSNSHISLTQRIQGNEIIISESDKVFPINGGQSMNVGVGVHGSQISCYLNGEEIVSGNLSPSLDHGGIGFKTWNANVNNSSLLVKKVKVE